ncbi:PD-(D/E)XK nuclease family protein [Winogradskyella immobilis]|uniref:PD-(D/E)XK nuclease family protein n=1 Tax=Winogradskyella immobilis TaxID=2816852 RepID=A0ABS8EM39_9FLAO|nr:PD-(D/E)XK nuclease family protein [Winogradskyella immobilis]MCC1483357.1 PD-(D/E)XK nuclease family protein [Winogradskyella immobilis]MCG0015451.1 PD-(D/E)XK nuclease family protein [Winogradskyella immobilis]
MTTFIEEVLHDLKKKNTDFSKLVFILPSKRAGVFLKYQLTKINDKTIFAPQIISIEEFVEDLSQLKNLSNSELLFHFYNTYKLLTPEKDLESFASFSKWGQILLQDFNEIDRYLIAQNQIFDYLNAIQELNHWSLQNEKTEFVTNYLNFWNKLKTYYYQFTSNLLNEGIGYQGLIYREAVENIESYIQNTNKHHVFLGFNALNSSEERIIQEFLQQGLASIYWDIDSHFINDDLHDAGLFTRQHRTNWSHYKTHSFKWISSNYDSSKNIKIIGCPKSVGQAKYVGEILAKLSKNDPNLRQTAVVLGEEELLLPILNSIPKTINTLNVTMGFPLKSIPLASLFEQLFSLHKKNNTSFYYKDILKILSHQMVQPLLKGSNTIIKYIQENNIVYLTAKDLKALTKDYKAVIVLLFENWTTNIQSLLNTCSKIIFKIKSELDNDKSNNQLELEYLYRFNLLFNELNHLNTKYNYLTDIESLHAVYKELLSSETLDFKGEPLDGLQIMGMLESRVLDFETVIITSVNEGILPSGKSNNSFIPFEVKLNNNLPTYKEKDAVYTYHFYRLLQRAKNVYIIYNTEVDALKGGEKSRFITQLEIEGIHKLKHTIVSPNVPVIEKTLTTVIKNKDIVERIKIIAKKGFSPSSLANYIRNPIDFYFEKILGIKETEDVEETVAANTLGSVIHNTLEDFYKPLEGQQLTTDLIKKMQSQCTERVRFHFSDIYKKGDIEKGKNLIIFEIAKRYISNFLNKEIEVLKAGNTIKIIAIEVENTIEINIPNIDFPINLTGKVDRVDELNGVTRIIDYKSGKVEQNKVEVVDWEAITTDYDKYSKSFQILMYAYMMYKQNNIQLPVEAGIISFKNLKQGFLKFGKKESPSSRTKEQSITETTIEAFEIELKKLITEICDINTDFIEKELD